MSHPKAATFREVFLPNDQVAFIPQDITIAIPTNEIIANERLHFLAYIPWDDKYLSKIPPRYKEFFTFTLPHLNARTTNVHTAHSVSFVAELIEVTAEKIDKDVLYLSVILHDSGWEQLEPDEIADSLDFSTFTYSNKARRPKELHASLGSRMAKQLLRDFPGDLDLSTTQKQYVEELVYYHDQIRPWPEKPEPIEYLLLGDADRLWSYTHDNFWLDTIRKNMPPDVYVQNIEAVIEDFFLTKQGRTIAQRLVAERVKEVELLTAFTLSVPLK